MAQALGELQIELTASTDRLLRGMRQAESSFRSAAGIVSSFNFLIGGAAVAAVTQFVASWARGADELGKFADRIGISVEQLSRLQFVAEGSGVAISTLNTSLQRQTRRISEAAAGNESYLDAINELGLSIETLVGLSPDQQFAAIAQAMEGVADQGDRVRLAMRFWDTEGVQLLQIVNEGAEAMERMMRRSDELGATLTRSATVDAARFNQSLQELSASFEGFANTVLPLVIPPLTLVLDTLTSLVNVFRNIGDAIDRWVVQPFTELATGTGVLASGFQEMFPVLTGIVRGFSQSADAAGRVNDEIQRSTDIITRNTQAVSDNDQTRKPLTITIDTSLTALERYNQTLEEQRLQFGQNQIAIQALLSWYDRLTLDEQIQNTEFLTRELQRLGGTVDEALGASTRTVEQWEDVSISATSGVAEAFRIMGRSITQENEDVFSQVLSVVQRTVAQIIETLTSSRIAEIIAGFFSGSGQTGGSAGAGAGRFGDILSSLIGGAFGAGLGAAAGGLLESVFGGGQERIRESLLYAGNTGRPLSSGLVTSVDSPFGTSISFGLARLGNRGQLSNEQAQRIIRQLEQAANIVAGIDEIIAGTLGADQLSAVTEAIGTGGRVREFSPEAVDAFIRERFTRIFGAFDEALAEAFSEFAVQFEGDELLEFTAGIATLLEQFDLGNRVFSDVATVAETVNILMEEFANHGENLRDVLERLNAANQALFPLGLSGDTQAGARRNLSILEAFENDAARLGQLVAGFFDTFFDEEENLTRAIEQLGGLVPDILANLGTTRETFAQDFLTGLEEGIFSPQQIRQWLEAAETLGQLVDLENQLNNVRQAVIDEQISALEATRGLLTEQIDNIEAYRRSIEDLSQSIAQSFGETIEDIQLSLLSTAEQYAFQQDRIAELTGQIASETDPERLAALLEEIERRATESLGLLTDEQRAALGPDFITFLTETLAAGQQRLTELSNDALAEQQALQEQRLAVEQEIAAQMQSAANAQNAGANQFQAAVGLFQQAVSTPIQVTLDTSNLVGA